MKKILITGTNGLLGQKLVDQLTTRPEIEVIATARGQNRLPSTKGYLYESLDITDESAVNACIASHKPDVVIHTAAMTNVDQCESEKDACWDLNVHAVANLIKACEEQNAFLVHLSTDFIFDGEAGPYTEEDEPNPISFYGWSKLAAEKLVEKAKCKWAIARTILVYGTAHDMSRSNIVLWVKNSIEGQKDINVVTDQWRTPTLAEDLAAGCILIAEKEAEGIFNISGEELLNPYQMAEKTADFFDLDKKYIHEASALTFSQPAKRPPRTGFDISKAKSVLGYKPRTFDEGIGILAEQMKA